MLVPSGNYLIASQGTCRERSGPPFSGCAGLTMGAVVRLSLLGPVVRSFLVRFSVRLRLILIFIVISSRKALWGSSPNNHLCFFSRLELKAGSPNCQ